MKTRRYLRVGLVCIVTALGMAQTTPAAPGKLVDLGGHRVHINCTGKGSPTVVVDTGFEEFSFDWVLVQTPVSQFARICTYDRAGYAWSDSGPLPRSFAQINLELRDALRQAGEHGPYLLVGHSFGGQTIREFARQYSKDVAGIVIAEGVSENQRIQMGPKNTGLIADSAAHKTIPPPHSNIIGSDRPNLPKLPDGTPPLEPPFDKLPAREQQLHVWAISRAALYAAEESERQWSAEYFARWREHPESARLGDIPLVVLTRADGGYGDDLDVPAAQLEQNRRESQASLAKLSTRGKQVIVRSGHNLQVEAPSVVVETIRSLIDEIRSRQPN